MLTIKTKLNELDENGLFLVRVLQNEKFPTIQGGDIQIDKFSTVFLRSILSRTERTRNFDDGGKPRAAPLRATEEKHLAASVRVFGDADNSLYTFAPVLELYNRGNRCVGCLMLHQHKWWEKPTDADEPDAHFHAERLNAGTETEQINRLGRYFRWWIAEGGFEPIAPTEPDMETERALNALFGKRREIPIDDKILIGGENPGEVSNN